MSAARLASNARILIACCALLLAIPAIVGFFFTDHEARGRWEKRDLAAIPAVADESPYFEGVSAFVDDHIGLAVPLNQLYRRLLFFGFRDSPIDRVTVGADGFAFLNSHDDTRQYQNFDLLCFDGQDNALVADRVALLARLYDLFASRGYDVSIGVAISKPVLYPEKLPGNLPQRYLEACPNYRETANVPVQVRDALLASGRTIHYPLEQFVEARNEDHFFPKNNFHWNGRSAHLFARSLFEARQFGVPEDFSAGARLISVRADMKYLGFDRNATVWRFPYRGFGVTQQFREPEFIREHFPGARDYSFFETENPMTERRALVLSNSFGRYLAPHLAPAYRSLAQANLNHLRPREMRRFFDEFPPKIGATDIILLIHDRALIDRWSLDDMIRALEPDDGRRKPRRRR
ncbi:MAG: hypothetical protein AAGE01_10785 [Pseudomonadota bacterium]